MRKEIYRIFAAMAVVLLVVSALWAGGNSPRFEVVSTIPTNGARGVVLDQVLTATFNQGLDCSTIDSPKTTFTLRTGHHGAVTGTVVCSGMVATFTPSSGLAPNTDYTATISGKVKDENGKRLECEFVWCFRTGSNSCLTAPTVTAVTPPNGATGVALNTKVTAAFNQAMNPHTINASTFTLTAGPRHTRVRGIITYDAIDNIATFTPNAPLKINTLYTATITTCVTNTCGAEMVSDFVWTFTTGVAPTVIPPTVISTIPVDTATGVPLNQIITATFSESMLGSTITTPPQFTLENMTTLAYVPNTSGVVTYTLVGTTATFTPGAPLDASTVYTATILTGVTDLAGNHLVSPYVWTFKTGSGVSVTSPYVVSRNPANNATLVCKNHGINATFNEPMDFGTFNTGTFYVTGPSPIVTTVNGTLSIDVTGTIVTFTPLSNLTAGVYTATITTGVTDLLSDPMLSNDVWSFTVGTGTCLAAVPLNSAEPFGVVTGTAGMTNSGFNTVVNGNMATTATAYGSEVGFHDLTVAYIYNTSGCIYTETVSGNGAIGLVTGEIYTANTTSPTTGNCPLEGTAATALVATAAWNDALNAYNNTSPASIPGGTDPYAGNLGSQTVYPGVYSTSNYLISGGDLTLDAQGDANAVWVFQMSGYLVVGDPATPRSVTLTNGAQAKNVFWYVSGATPNVINAAGGGTMVGTLLTYSGVVFSTAGYTVPTVLDGRAIGLYASVTMVDTVINVPLP